jgi:hypothetical protein
MNFPENRTMPRARGAAVVALMLSTAFATAPAVAEIPTYHATPLDAMIETVFPGVTFPSSDARGLNENGDLVGEAWLNGNRMQAFVYTVEHGITPLPFLPDWSSAAVRDVTERDANGEIIIVGGSTFGVHTDIAVGEAMLWRFSTVTGEVLETRGLGFPPGFDESIAMAVNNDGAIVGVSGVWGPYTSWKYDIATGVLEVLDFPARVTDLNNAGQVCGGKYRGDLFGSYVDLSDDYEPGDVMPQWAIENGGISAGWRRMNDLGWLVGRAGTGISDGAGHFLVAIVRFADPIGWVGMDPVSHLDLAGGINDLGDFTDRFGGMYLEETGQVHSLNALLAPEWQPLVDVYRSDEINNNRQVAGAQAHAFLLTPLGEMIIPGDVNGDVSVDLDDHCAWTVDPIDLDGDGDVDADDEQWLLDRLAVFGYTVEDCNGNGIGDHCDIVDGTSLDCDGNDVPDECQPDCSGDGVPDACEPDCNENGVPDACDIADGTSEDCNGNGIPDECDAGGVTEVLVTHDPPVFMYQADSIVQEVLVVDAGIVDDVDVFLDYRYRIGYTKVEVSHGGTTVTILDRPGHPAHVNGFVNFGYVATVDDDEMGPLLEETGDFCCSFETILSPPSYRPNEPLDAFDGMPSEGIWTFTISTTPDFSSGDGLHGWGLTITRAGVPVEPCNSPDIDGDGVVGFGDLVRVLAAWGPCPSGCPEDLDEDGVVGFADLLRLLGEWSA